MQYLLSSIVFLPLLGALFVVFSPPSNSGLQRYVTLFFSAATLVLSCVLVFYFDSGVASVQFRESHHWIAAHNIAYLVAVDGISVIFVPLTTLLFCLSIFASPEKFQGAKGYYGLMLVLESAILGTFVAQDLFLFFLFWTASLLPVFFLVGIWGNRSRELAATRFFLYQLAGAGLLMVGLLIIYFVQPSNPTFNLVDLFGGKFSLQMIEVGGYSLPVEYVVFGIMSIGFAIRMGVFPFHGWFTHLQVEAPVALAPILASVFIETAAYGILRVSYGLFPTAAQMSSKVFALMGVVNLLYGAFCALGQKDIRKLVAYFCVSQMGLVLLSLGSFSTTAFHGMLLLLFSYGLSAGLLFFLLGLLGKRSGQFQMVNAQGEMVFGGLVSKAPLLTGFFSVALFSALGLPGLSGFPAELLVFLGSFPFHRVVTALCLLAMFLTAGYLLWMYRKVFWGAPGSQSEQVHDLTTREKVFLVPLVFACVVLGVYPAPLIQLSQATIGTVLAPLAGKQ